MKILRGTPKHLSCTGQLTGFAYLMLTLPFKCNFKCLKCFNLTEGRPVAAGTPITLEQTLSMIDEAQSLGAKAVVIAGEGEPTLDPNIRRIVCHIDDLAMIPIVYSNGHALTPPVAQFYRERNACLVIALDSLKTNTYSLLTGMRGEVLSRVIENLAHLRRVYADTVEECSGLRILRLAVNMTICSRNKTEIADVRAFAGNDIYFVCNPLARHGNADGYWDILVDSDDDFVEQQRLAQSHSESGGPLTLDRMGLCGYSVNGIAIGPSGHYMTCAYTSMTNGLLGTIRDRTLREAYEFKNAMERKHYAEQGPLPCLIRAPSFSFFLAALTSAGANPMRRSGYIARQSQAGQET